MDRMGTATWTDSAWDDDLLPSREDAAARLRDALEAGPGLALLTGDSGAGKSWLLQRLRHRMPGAWRWARTDLSPSVGAVEFYRLILHELGIGGEQSLSAARADLSDFLTDRAADAERWVLCVEEGHGASLEALEELRILANRLGEVGAFTGLILTGQNALRRRLSSRALAPLAARLTTHVHLHPLSIEELRIWIAHAPEGVSVDSTVLESLHREVAGNPRLLRHRLGRVQRSFDRPAREPAPVTSIPPRPLEAVIPAQVDVAESKPTWTAPLVTSGKPPLEVGDEMIEVGWASGQETDFESELEVDPERPIPPHEVETPHHILGGPGDANPPAEERVDDHYAALQAWTEWAQNQDRQPVAAQPDPTPTPYNPEIATHDDGPGDRTERSTPVAPGVWAEGQQSFAPYSQLFTRLRESRDPR